MDRYSRLAANTAVLMLGQFGSKLLVYIMMRFYTDMLGADGYGAVGNIVDAAVLCMGFATLSVGEAVIRFGSDDKYDKSQVFSIGLITTLAGLICFIPFVPLIGMVDFLSKYAVIIYIYVFTGSIKSAVALFVRSSVSVRLYAVDGIVTTVMNILFNLLFLLAFDMGVFGYVISVVAADVCSIIFLFVSAKLNRYFILFGLSRKLAGKMYRYCIPLIPTSIMWWVTNVSDGFFVTAMMGSASTGVYKAAYKLPNIIALISGVFSQAWNMSAITEKNSRTIAKFYTDVFGFLQAIVYVSAAGLLLVIKPALDLMTANVGFENAYRHSPFLIMSVVFSCYSTFNGSMYIAAKKSGRSMLTATLGAVVNIGLNCLFIPPMGLDGAALATFVSYLTVFAVRAVDTRSIVYMDYNPIRMFVNLVIIAGMCAVVMLADGQAYWILLVIMFSMIIILNANTGVNAVKAVLGRKK